MVTSEEVGDDFEHVEAQKKKFDDYQKVRISFAKILMYEWPLASVTQAKCMTS